MADRPTPPKITIGGGKQAAALQNAFNALLDYQKSVLDYVETFRPQPGVGTRLNTGPGGTTIDAAVQRGSGSTPLSCPHAFSLELTSNGTLAEITLTRHGAIYPIGVATNAFDTGDPWSSGTYDASLVKWVLAHVETDGNAATSWELVLSATPAPPIGISAETAPVEFWIDLAVAYGGRVKRVIPCGNLRVTPVIVLVTDKETPICAEEPTISHYSWDVEVEEA